MTNSHSPSSADIADPDFVQSVEVQTEYEKGWAAGQAALQSTCELAFQQALANELEIEALQARVKELRMQLSGDVAQPTREGKSPEWFCQWLKGYLGGIPGRDELDAFEANSIRNTLNEVLAAQPPAAPVETKCDCLPWPDKCPYCGGDAPVRRLSAATGDEPDSRLPLQYEDGPDYCTVKDAQGRDFALTMQPELMRAMERALREDISRLLRPPVPPTEPQAAPVIVGYQRRNIGPDGTPWSSWYPANDEPTPENMKFDGYLSYEYRPVHAGSPLPRPKL